MARSAWHGRPVKPQRVVRSSSHDSVERRECYVEPSKTLRRWQAGLYPVDVPCARGTCHLVGYSVVSYIGMHKHGPWSLISPDSSLVFPLPSRVCILARGHVLESRMATNRECVSQSGNLYCTYRTQFFKAAGALKLWQQTYSVILALEVAEHTVNINDEGWRVAGTGAHGCGGVHEQFFNNAAVR